MPEINENTTGAVEAPPAPRRRGRPPGSGNKTNGATAPTPVVAKVNGVGRPAKRGRPAARKSVETVTPAEMRRLAAWLLHYAKLAETIGA